MLTMVQQMRVTGRTEVWGMMVMALDWAVAGATAGAAIVSNSFIQRAKSLGYLFQSPIEIIVKKLVSSLPFSHFLYLFTSGMIHCVLSILRVKS